jgi:hypothetical protein
MELVSMGLVQNQRRDELWHLLICSVNSDLERLERLGGLTC